MNPFNEIEDLSAMCLKIDNEQLSLSSFMTKCADSLSNPGSASLENKELIKFRDRFLEGGLKALYSSGSDDGWIQFGLSLGASKELRNVHKQLYQLATEFIEKDLVNNFFFMYKPPGMRIRFEAKSGDRGDVLKLILINLKKWVRKKIIVDFVPGIYEPESHLFGGELSMPYVHKLFTIDSLALLEFGSLALDKKKSDPDWLLSMVMLKDLFSALGISGWEDMDVWDRIRRKTFRSLPDEMNASPEFSSAAAEIKNQWQRSYLLPGMLSPATKKIIESFKNKIQPVITDWKKNYFETTDAYIGIREATAFFTIFHWNRTGLSFPRQCIIAEALALRE